MFSIMLMRRNKCFVRGHSLCKDFQECNFSADQIPSFLISQPCHSKLENVLQSLAVCGAFLFFYLLANCSCMAGLYNSKVMSFKKTWRVSFFLPPNAQSHRRQFLLYSTVKDALFVHPSCTVRPLPPFKRETPLIGVISELSNRKVQPTVRWSFIPGGSCNTGNVGEDDRSLSSRKLLLWNCRLGQSHPCAIVGGKDNTGW